MNLSLGHQQDSDPISYSNAGLRGPLNVSRPRKKKALAEICDSIKIPYAPSYFTALLQSQIKPNLDSAHPDFNHPIIKSKMNNGVGNHRRLESSISSGDSITDSGIHRGNHRIWKAIESIQKKFGILLRIRE